MRNAWFIKTLAAVLGACLPFPALAHEGAEHEIEELTERMKVERDSPELLIQRAIEFKVLGKFAEAAADLERAMALDHESVTARRELGQAYFELGKTNEALAVVTLALNIPAEPPERASLLMTRAAILRARRDLTQALNDANAAIQAYPDNVEWYVVRSHLQVALKLQAPRVTGLEDGIRQTGSGLLVAEWIDALIDAGRPEEALASIEKELQESRWTAAWLIRRAKVRLATGKTREAETDLQLALDELNDRLRSGALDVFLLADRGLTQDLLGKKAEARRDYSAAREKGMTDEWLRDRLRALRDSAKGDE